MARSDKFGHTFSKYDLQRNNGTVGLRVQILLIISRWHWLTKVYHFLLLDVLKATLKYFLIVIKKYLFTAVACDLNHPLYEGASKVGLSIGEMIEEVISVQGLSSSLIYLHSQ